MHRDGHIRVNALVRTGQRQLQLEPGRPRLQPWVRVAILLLHASSTGEFAKIWEFWVCRRSWWWWWWCVCVCVCVCGYPWLCSRSHCVRVCLYARVCVCTYIYTNIHVCVCDGVEWMGVNVVTSTDQQSRSILRVDDDARPVQVFVMGGMTKRHQIAQFLFNRYGDG